MSNTHLISDRPVGRPSKASKSSVSEIERSIRQIVSSLTQTLSVDIEKMSVKEKTDLLGKLLPYVLKEGVKEPELNMDKLVTKYLEKKMKSK